MPKHQSRLSFPKEIVFDQFLASVKDGTNPWVQQQMQLAFDELGIKHRPELQANARASLLDTLERAKVFVLTGEALDVVIHTAERLREKAAIGQITLPACPMWVEFEGTVLRDKGRGIRALWFLPEVIGAPTQLRDGSFSVIQLHSDEEAEVDERLIYSTKEQAWRLSYAAGCKYGGKCPLATSHAHHLPDFPGMMTGLHLHQRRDAFAALNAGCLCYEDGQEWVHLLWVLAEMLRAEGAKHTVVDRRFQIRSKKAHKSTFEKEQERAQVAWNATHPVYVRISLEYRWHVRRDQKPSGQTLVYEEGEGHTTQIVGHWRLLIPAPDKPWRGERPRIIWVRNHERYVHGKRRVRYHVTP